MNYKDKTARAIAMKNSKDLASMTTQNGTAPLTTTAQTFKEAINEVNAKPLGAKGDTGLTGSQGIQGVAGVAGIGTPKGTYTTVALLQAAHTTNDSNIYVCSADGHIYSWSGSAYTDTGIQYQSTGIAPKSVGRTESKTNLSMQLVIPNGAYIDFNTTTSVISIPTCWVQTEDKYISISPVTLTATDTTHLNSLCINLDTNLLFLAAVGDYGTKLVGQNAAVLCSWDKFLSSNLYMLPLPITVNGIVANKNKYSRLIVASGAVINLDTINKAIVFPTICYVQTEKAFISVPANTSISASSNTALNSLIYNRITNVLSVIPYTSYATSLNVNDVDVLWSFGGNLGDDVRNVPFAYAINGVVSVADQLTNMITNSGVVTDTTGWAPIASRTTISASNGEIVNTVTTVSNTTGLTQSKAVDSTHVYYFGMSLFPKYSSGGRLGFGDTTVPYATVTPNVWNDLFGIMNGTSGSDKTSYFIHDATPYTIGDTFKIKNAIELDLTAMFGAGNEPTAKEMYNALRDYRIVGYNMSDNKIGKINIITKTDKVYNESPYGAILAGVLTPGNYYSATTSALVAMAGWNSTTINVTGMKKVYLTANVYGAASTLAVAFNSVGAKILSYVVGTTTTIPYVDYEIILPTDCVSLGVTSYGIAPVVKAETDSQLIKDVILLKSTVLAPPPSAANATSSILGQTNLVIGDSITASHTYTTRLYHEYLSDRMGTIVLNKAISATGWMCGGANTTIGTAQSFKQRIVNGEFAGLTYDFCTIMFGTNDWGVPDIAGTTGVTLGAMGDTSGVASIYGGLKYCLGYMLSTYPTKALGVISPVPRMQSGATALVSANQKGVTLEQVCQAVKDMCAYYAIPYLDLIHASRLQPWNTDNASYYYADGQLHPNDNGHKVIERQIENWVTTL